jgi:hypothetical protein
VGGEDTDPASGQDRDEAGAAGEPGRRDTPGGEPDPAGARAERTGAADATAEPLAGQAALLGEMRTLRRRARAARHAYWFPLVLYGLLICAAVPFYIVPRNPAGGAVEVPQGGPLLPVLGGFPGITVQRYLGYYWVAALLAGLLLTLLWYRRNGRRVGLQTSARGYVTTVTALTVLAVVIPLLSQVRSPHWLSWLRYLDVLWPGDLVLRGTFPFVIIALGLWVLARAERSRGLAVIAALYTTTALLSSLYNTENILFKLGWSPSGTGWSLTSLPNVLLPALVLLAAGAGAFAAQRGHRVRA